MLPLASSTVPKSAEALVEALRDGLAAYHLSARELTARGAWPSLDTLRLDLTGTRVARTQRLPLAGTTAQKHLAAGSFTLAASPLFFEQTPIAIAVNATEVSFAFEKNDADSLSLVPTGAAHGDLSIEIQREPLQTLLHGLAVEAAKPHGADIKKTQLEIASRSPRELSFRAQVTAKMFFVSAVLGVTGDVAVDDQLNARLANLRFDGEGMVANAAGGFIRPQLEKLEGRTFPLMAFSLGTIRLRDIQLRGGDSLRLTAQFGDVA